MSAVVVDLPVVLQSWVDDRLASGDYADAADYLRDLVDRDRARAADVAWVQARLAEGEASGYLDEDPSQIIEDLIAEIPAQDG